jgi:hypothetical protein
MVLASDGTAATTAASADTRAKRRMSTPIRAGTDNVVPNRFRWYCSGRRGLNVRARPALDRAQPGTVRQAPWASRAPAVSSSNQTPPSAR